MTITEIKGSYKKGSIDSLLPIIHKIQKISDNPTEYLKDYFDISFEIDLLSGVMLKIDKKRIFMQTAFGENQLADAIYEGCLSFVKWYKNNKL